MRNHRSLSGIDRGITVRLAVACVAMLSPLVTATTADAAPPTASLADSLADRPAPPRAVWGLETHPWTSGPEEALDDQQPALDDTPLTGTNIGWEDDVRILGSGTVSLDGRSSYLSASPATLSTAETFSITAWVRLTDTSVSRTLASKAGTGRDTFTVGYDKAANRWQVRMPSRTGKGGRVAVVRSVSVPQAGLWTHLAVTHDADARTLTLWVNGTAEATVSRVTTVDDPSGAFRLGRGDTGWWQGNVAQVRVYDRVLAGPDFTGRFASDPDSGGFEEPGLLEPWMVGRWGFEGATPCYEEDLDPTLCSAPDSTAFDRQLTLTRGADIVSTGGGNALELNDTHWVDDPSDPHYGETTREYGRSQVNVGEPANPVWQDGSVLRTDQSFTVSAWVRLDPARGAQSVVSQDDGDRSAFHLGFEPADGGRWVFGLTDGSAITSTSAPAADLERKHHLVAVLDATRRQARLYVDGTPAGTICLSAAWQLRQATGSLLVGRSTTPAGPVGWLFGEVDAVNAYQGALSDADVRRLFSGQSV